MSRRKKEYRTYSRENYEVFIKENNISERDLTYPKYCKNLQVCNWMFVEYALRTGVKVSLPHGFGSLAVNKKMLKKYKIYKDKDGLEQKKINLRIDWKKTNELGKKIYHTNEHTDGYNYRWIWFVPDAKIFLSSLYIFKPGRYASRAINKYLRKPNSDYKHMYLEWLT